MKRIYMNFEADTGTNLKEGYVFGEIRAVRIIPGTLDSGIGLISLAISPDPNDTGDGVLVYSQTDTGINHLQQYFSLEDTGGDWYVGAGDKLTGKMKPKTDTGGDTTAGEIWVYYSEKV